VNPLVKRYVRHAERFGDPRTVFETAARDSSLSAVEVGYLAAQLRRLEPTEEGGQYWSGGGAARKRERWPRFRLTEREKDRLGRQLLEADVPVKTIASYLGVTPRRVKDRTDYWRAVSEWVRLGGVVPGYGIGPPVDLLDAAGCDSSLYRVLATIMGHGSDSANSTRDRLSRSGIPGEIVTAGLRFGRLEVLHVERDHTNRKIAVCRCDCGNETTAKPSHLLRGEKRSCGCLRRERMAATKRTEEAAG
jgi:hypothetical protein